MSIVANRRVVVTGKIAGESRKTAETKLREAGAIVQDKVRIDTDILVAGEAVGETKMRAARQQGIDVITWEQAFGEDTGNYAAAAAPRAPMPNVRHWQPMRCSPTDALPVGDEWTFELKWDGLRAIATVHDGNVNLQSRNGRQDLTPRYPNVCDELVSSLKENCVLDGELVDGRFMVFDLLSLDHASMVNLPLHTRHEDLIALVKDGTHVGVSPKFDDGQALLRYVTDNKLEGVVAKRKGSYYVEGAENQDWLKLKVRLGQEFIICGYTLGEGSRASTFGSLILGYYKDGVLTCAGHVGTGWDARLLRELYDAMQPHKVQQSHPGFPKEKKQAVYLEPVLLCDVEFQRWTEDNVLYHTSFVALRDDDKDAKDVVRET